MPGNTKESISITAGNYTFTFSGRKLIAVPIPMMRRSIYKNKERLKVIAKAYEEYKRVMKSIGRPLNGEWRWCVNPECFNAFYALRFKIEQGQGLCCCRRCAGKVFGAQKENE